jgi:hypothetical protein
VILESIKDKHLFYTQYGGDSANIVALLVEQYRNVSAKI